MQSEKYRIKHFDHCIVHVVHEHMSDAPVLHIFKHSACFERAEDAAVAVWSKHDILVFCQKQSALFGQCREMLLAKEMDILFCKPEAVVVPEEIERLCMVDISCHNIPVDRLFGFMSGCSDLFRLQFKQGAPVKRKRGSRSWMLKARHLAACHEQCSHFTVSNRFLY